VVAEASGRSRTIWLGSIHLTCLMRDHRACNPFGPPANMRSMFVGPVDTSFIAGRCVVLVRSLNLVKPWHQSAPL
jgi:hypothetical protein